MIWEKLREGGSKEGAERQEEGRAEDETQSFAGGKAGRRRSRRRGAGEERSCLEPAEGEGQLILVQGYILGQRHGEIKAEGKVGDRKSVV